MPETATKRLIERFLAALGAGDHEAALACLGEDVIRDVEGGGREIGIEKFRWFLGLAGRHFSESIADIVVMTDESGRRAAAEFTLRGTYVGTVEGWPEAKGQRYSLPAGMFFEVEDGAISRLTPCRDVERWKAELAKAD